MKNIMEITVANLITVILLGIVIISITPEKPIPKQYEYYINLEPNHIEITDSKGNRTILRYGKLDQFLEETNQ